MEHLVDEGGAVRKDVPRSDCQGVSMALGYNFLKEIGGAAYEVRDGDQHEDRQGARFDDSPSVLGRADHVIE
jgi:hypothetical protein